MGTECEPGRHPTPSSTQRSRALLGPLSAAPQTKPRRPAPVLTHSKRCQRPQHCRGPHQSDLQTTVLNVDRTGVPNPQG